MIRILRWIAVVPACIAAWYVVLFLGLHLLGIVESFCPPELVVSGMCNADWYLAAEQTVICISVAFSAFLVILTAAFLAPSHKILVSRVALGVGILVAAAMGMGAGAYLEMASAILTGIVTESFVTMWLRRPRLEPGDVA